LGIKVRRWNFEAYIFGRVSRNHSSGLFLLLARLARLAEEVLLEVVEDVVAHFQAFYFLN